MLVVDDLINGHPSWSASPMMHVNLEGIGACLAKDGMEIAGVCRTDIYISILTSTIAVCTTHPLYAYGHSQILRWNMLFAESWR